MNTTNRYTEFQLYWYDESTCFWRPFCPQPGVLSRMSALVRYMKLWWPHAACHPTPASTRSSQLHIMYQSRRTAQNSWWWAERLPETCRFVITIKLELSASVGFIHFNLLRCTVIRTLIKVMERVQFVCYHNYICSMHTLIDLLYLNTYYEI